MKKLIAGSITFAIFAILIFNLYKNAFKSGKFTCNRYILNTYLYILLSLASLIVIVAGLEEYNIDVFSKVHFLLLFALVIGLLIATKFVPAKMVFLKHLIWFIFLIGMGVFLHPLYRKYKGKVLLLEAIIVTLVIVTLFSILAFIKPEWISLSWRTGLVSFLLIAIIMRLVQIFSKTVRNIPFFNQILSYGIVLLFVIFLLYDTKRLQINAKQCIEKTVDYINESLGIFLDVVNIFVNYLSGRGSG